MRTSVNCPHCATAAFIEFDCRDFPQEDNRIQKLLFGLCPACRNLIVKLTVGEARWQDDEYVIVDPKIDDRILFPTSCSRPIDPSVPDDIREDYREACQTLWISSRASAALSRRILQRILREEYSISRKTLFDEIKEFAVHSEAPAKLRQLVDKIRQIGNFAAHPEHYEVTGEIVEVTLDEAEWLLDVLDELFEFTYVKPSEDAGRKQKLESKLATFDKKYSVNKSSR